MNTSVLSYLSVTMINMLKRVKYLQKVILFRTQICNFALMNQLLSKYISLRTANGFSQTQVAIALGLANKSSISTYEAERKKPSLSAFMGMLFVIGYELAIIPKGMRDVALELCEGKVELVGSSISQDICDYKVLLNEMKIIRVSKQISQTDFAEALGVGNCTMVSRYEKGLSNPTIDRMDEMLNILGYELAIVPKGYRDFARTVCEEKAKMDSSKEE